MSSLEMNCKEPSKTFLFLANGGCKQSDKQRILNESQAKRINALMQTCVFYDESGEFTFKVGLPGKSGVGRWFGSDYAKQIQHWCLEPQIK